MTFPALYTLDAGGKPRFWRLELNPENPAQYRTVAGQVGGAEVASGWTTASAKNAGRANATTPEQQAIAEIEAEYSKKRARKYHDSLDGVGRHKFFAPMLARNWTGWTGEPVWVQPKLDGLRCIATQNGLTSREGKPFHLPHIFEALAPLFEKFPDLVFDGELYNHEFCDDFPGLTSLIKRDKRTPDQEAQTRALVQYHVYDLPSVEGGFDLRNELLSEMEMEWFGSEPIHGVKTFQVNAKAAFDRVYDDFLADGYEGMMVRLDQPYEIGKRSKSLLKRKDFVDGEFKLLDVQEGNGNWAGCAKGAHIELPDGRTQSTGMRGSQARLKEMLSNWRNYQQVTVRYQGLLPEGKLRFPRIVDWHEGARVY